MIRSRVEVGTVFQQVGRDAQLPTVAGLPKRVVDVVAVGRRGLLVFR